MPALTELLDKPIYDPNGDDIARLQDLVVRLPSATLNGDNESHGVETAFAIASALTAGDGRNLPNGRNLPVAPTDLYPPVIGLVARLKGPRGSRDVFIPWDKVQSLSVRGATLRTPAVNLQRFAKRDGEIVLHGLFDRQVVDVEGRRIVRINDLDVSESAGVWRLVAVDVSFGALLRRLPAGPGMETLSRRITALLGRETATRAPLIDWAMVAPVSEAGAGEEGALRLRVPRDKLAMLHPADLASLIEQLTPQQGADLLQELDSERAADTLEELEDERQAQILRAMDPERAADVLEEMEPDEATDALQGVSDTEAADLLGRMDREDAAEVQELLGYPEDSAGGIMTTEYISVPEWATIGEIIAALRARSRDTEDPLPDALPELYVIAEDRPPIRSATRRPPLRPGARNARPRGASPAVLETERGPLSLEAEGRLVGIIALRDLLLGDPTARITTIMRPAECVAQPLEDEREVARIIADEDLVALPIIDAEGKMLGIVTVDDAIDVILPTAWKKRIPRRFR